MTISMLSHFDKKNTNFFFLLNLFLFTLKCQQIWNGREREKEMKWNVKRERETRNNPKYNLNKKKYIFSTKKIQKIKFFPFPFVKFKTFHCRFVAVRLIPKKKYTLLFLLSSPHHKSNVGLTTVPFRIWPQPMSLYLEKKKFYRLSKDDGFF